MPSLFWRKKPSPLSPPPQADLLPRADAHADRALEWLTQLENADVAHWPQTLVDAAAHISGAEHVLLVAEDPRTLEWTPRAARGFSPQTLSEIHLLPGQSLDRFFPGPSLLFPLHVNGRPWGVLAVGASQEKAVKPYLTLIVQHASMHFAHEELRGGQEVLVDQTVEALSRAIEAKDEGTHGHLTRVRTLSRILAQTMNLPEAWVNHIERGALLHDVGKIGIPEAILTKPGKLTDKEYALIQRHPTIGYQLISSVPALEPAACIALYHQEWFNGQGYPEGLAGQEIPLGARLVQVVDAWDAMVSDRPYRKAMPKSAAIAELRRYAGTQFDPKIVEIFLKTGAAAASS